MLITRTGATLAIATALLAGLAACTTAADDGTPAESPTQQGSTPQSAPPSKQSSGAATSRSPERLFTSSARAAATAETVRLDLESASSKGSATYSLNLTEGGLVGQMNLPEFGSMDVIVADGYMYLRGEQNMYSRLLSPEVAPSVAGKWLKLPQSELVNSGFAPATQKLQWMALLLSPEKDTTWKVSKETKEIDGVESIGLDSGKRTVWIADTGEPYPVAIEPADPSAGSVRFSAWNAPVDLQAPPEDEVVDLTQQAQPGP